MRLSIAGLLVVTLLAGCSGGGKDADTPGGLDPGDVDTGGRTVGAISGVVVDQAIRPIAGATVTLLARGDNATTDESGLFSFSGLEPGFHAMTATAPLHIPAQVTTDVLAGEVSKVRVQLVLDPAPQPYHVTYSHDGFMQAWAGIGQFFVESLAESGTCDCRLYLQPEPNATTIVYEAVWEQSSPDPLELAEFYYILEEIDGDLYDSGYCYSPCHVRNELGDYGGGEVMARLDGPDLWVSLQQPIQLFVTVWHNGPAPADWSLLDAG